MKQILFLLLFSAFSNFINATDPTISLSCSGTAPCQYVDPGVQYLYNATVTDNGNNYTYYNYSYTFSDNNAFSSQSGNNATFLFVKWNDLNEVVTLTVTASYKDGSGTQQSISASLPVTIKYIAPITSMNVNGSSYSNYGNANVSCGPQNVSVSIPAVMIAPTTGGATVVYSWSAASGYTVSGSGTSVTVAVDAGTTDGYINVTAHRSDGTYTVTAYINFVRPRVTRPFFNSTFDDGTPVAEGTTICINQIVHASQSSGNNATSWTWNGSGPLSVYTGYPPNACIYSATGNGTGNLTLTTDNACNAPLTSYPKTIYCGTNTSIGAISIDGHSNQSINYINGNTYIAISPRGDRCESYK